MDSVVRATVVYAVLLILFRLAGKRTLAEVTTFDFVLLLIISEATQQAMVGSDNSMTNSLLLVGTLVGLNILMSELKQRFAVVERVLDGMPLLIVEHGKPLQDRMAKERVDVDDVLDAARESHGLERLDQIKYAVLERNGKISIIPGE
ncbi:MAG TPA: YetF domain-containing protein [Steroidobacteraceae bacterium]|nr:YetF domain-containing protein [Steroidobacteraceae bacterium]